MFDSEVVASLREIIHSSSSTLILLKSNPSYDQLASALALLIALQSQKKESYIVCADPMRVEYGNLVAVDQVQQTIGNRSLQISFDYDEKTVENVSYNIDHENKKFHLVVRPQRGHRPLDPSLVEYSHTGLDADVIFLIGVGDYAEIPQYYQAEEAAFHQAHVVSLNKFPATYAEINLDGSQTATFSEMMNELIQGLELEINSDIATNLLAGIEQATDSFRHYGVSADTFEAVANLMRKGARRIKSGGTQQPSTSTQSLAQAFSSQLQKNPVTLQPATAPKPVEVQDTTAVTGPEVQQLQRMQVPGDYTPDKR